MDMLVLTGGKERDIAEFDTLLAAAGLGRTKVSTAEPSPSSKRRRRTDRTRHPPHPRPRTAGSACVCGAMSSSFTSVSMQPLLMGVSFARSYTAGIRRRGAPLPPRRRDRWFVDETYVKVAGRWIYLYRAMDQFGQVIDVLISTRS